MQEKKPPKSNNRRTGQSTGQPRGVPFWLVRSFLGSILVTAGALKLYELAFEAHEESITTLLLLLFAEAELLGGAWMVVGIHVVRTRRWAAAVFVGLAVSSLFQALGGKCSCGCFGTLSVNPWFVFVFDLAAVAALLGSRLAIAPGASPLGQPLHIRGLAILALLICIVGWQQADRFTVTGTVMADGGALKEARVGFTGPSGIITLRTDHDGNFRLTVVRPGLYAVSAPGRLSTLIPSPKEVGRRPVKKTPQRLGHQPAVETDPSTRGSLLWFEVSKCWEDGKIIEFK